MDNSERQYLTNPQTGTLRLSEAIRIGARLRPQGFSDAIGNGTSCALAAALDGIEFDMQNIEVFPYHTITERFGIGRGMMTEIWHRNDVLRWPREQIADWLEAQGY